MRVQIIVQAVGKGRNIFKNKDGQTVESRYGNFSQDGGAIVDTLRLTQEQFDAWEPGRTYIVKANLAKSHSNGLYLQVLDIVPDQPGK